MFYLFYGIQYDFIEKYLILIKLLSFLNLLIVFDVVALRKKKYIYIYIYNTTVVVSKNIPAS